MSRGWDKGELATDGTGENELRIQKKISHGWTVE